MLGFHVFTKLQKSHLDIKTEDDKETWLNSSQDKNPSLSRSNFLKASSTCGEREREQVNYISEVVLIAFSCANFIELCELVLTNIETLPMSFFCFKLRPCQCLLVPRLARGTSTKETWSQAAVDSDLRKTSRRSFLLFVINTQISEGSP